MRGTLSAFKWSIFLFWGCFYLYVFTFVFVHSSEQVLLLLLVSGQCVCMCVVLQPVWCSVYPHQKQNPPPACHRPGHRECTLYSHTQEDPQVPPAFCESDPIIVSLFVIEHIEFLYKRDDRERVPFLLVCFPLVVNVENVETMRLVESDSTKNIFLLLCVCSLDVWNAKASFHEANSWGTGHWYLPRHCFHSPEHTHHQSAQHLCGETSVCSTGGGWVW